jgi:hypothetical protein
MSVQADSTPHGFDYLEETELVRGLVRSDNQGLDVPHIDIAAGDGESWRKVSGRRLGDLSRRSVLRLTKI